MKYIEIYSREGNFNFCDPQEKSISTSFYVFDGDGKKRSQISGVSIRTEHEISSSDVSPEELIDYVVSELECWDKRVWISTQRNDVAEFKKYLLENKGELIKGTLERELELLSAKKESIEKKIKETQLALRDLDLVPEEN